ncbi:hypothetical protein [Geothrix campi]|uniref:hypothetical protein n=1 Tax=Geothrix campi TaxID=2966450 RepID=UPI0021480BFE|nr:hypothetical protein [Geothrix sp. SG10]
MRLPTWRFLIGFTGLLLMAACGGGGSNSSSSQNAQITLQAQFEKRALSISGLGATSLRPARYCWAEVRDVASGALLASGYLGSDGTGVTSVPRGSSVYVQVFAQYQVPSADPNSFFMQGSVKNAPMPSTYVSGAAFDAIPAWSVTSSAFLADQDGTLSVKALASNRIAGAFNIADQAVAFAATVRDMDGSGTLRLPSLHTFWTTSTNPVDQQRTYPVVTRSSSSSILTGSGRALFSQQVYGLDTGAANTETDEWDDGVLQETFARLLFADYSYQADGSSSLSLLRRDNDNAWVDRGVQSESTLAFVAGFSDFLSAAVRNNSQILDSYVDTGGVPRVDVFDLTDHTYVPTATKGEFARGSVAVSLWGIWKNVLGGGSTGLNTLWAAVRSTAAYPNGTGEYEQATLGCYPTYLQGVASRVSALTWQSALNELALEFVPSPDATYFAGTALWQTSTLPLNASGTLQTYVSSANIYYDRDQSQAWRFVHIGGARTITMTPTGGQDFYLELLGPGGWVAGSYGTPGSTRTLSLGNLPAGTYAARVRAGATTATGSYGYTITIN